MALTSPKTIEEYVAVMKKHGLTYLEVEGVKLVRNPQLEEQAPQRAEDPHPREIFRDREPPSNMTHDDLWIGHPGVPRLEDYTQTGEANGRGRDPMK